MSIFTTIIKDIESFASKAEKELANLWNKAPSFVDVALTTLTYIAPILETVFTLETGAAGGSAVTAVITKAEQELTAAKGLLSKIGPTPSVSGLLSGINSDLSSLLSAANITNPTSVANLKLVLAELEALVNSFPATTTVTAA